MSDRAQSTIGGPETRASHQCRSEKVNVHPPKPTAPEPTLGNEHHRLVIRDSGNPGQRSHECQDFIAARESATRQLPKNEIVTFGLAALESVDERYLWTVKMVDPDRRVDQH